MEWISVIWNSVEVIEAGFEAVDAVEAAGGIYHAVVGP